MTTGDGAPPASRAEAADRARVTALIAALTPIAEVSGRFPEFGRAWGLEQSGDFAAARAAYLETVDEPALTALCLQRLACLASATGAHRRAVALLHHAIRIDAGLLAAHWTLVGLMEVLQDAPGWVRALSDLGHRLFALDHHAEAGYCFESAIALDPLDYAAQVNAGTCAARLGRLDEAAARLTVGLELYARAVPELAPAAERLRSLGPAARASPLPPGDPHGPLDGIEEALTTLGHVFDQVGLPAVAIDCHRQSIAARRDFALAHWNLGLALLAAGDFEGGWREFEWRWRWPGFADRHLALPAPPWTNQPLEGKRVVVCSEQGFGDVIQFTPLVTRLAEAAARVRFEVPRPLLSLLRYNLPDVEVVEASAGADGARPFEPDMAVPLLSLPMRLGVRRQTLPLSRGYLSAPPDTADRWSARLGDAGLPRVGLCWAGRPQPDPRRSLPPDMLGRLVASRAVRWYSLQVGERADDLRAEDRDRVADLGRDFQDFSDTAGALDHLDLVITIDTAVAHLAGAMGKPTWLLLPPHPDWRWREPGVSSSWYPSIRRFAFEGGWPDTIARVHTALEGLRW